MEENLKNHIVPLVNGFSSLLLILRLQFIIKGAVTLSFWFRLPLESSFVTSFLIV
jgi:hypothetical protein